MKTKRVEIFNRIIICFLIILSIGTGLFCTGAKAEQTQYTIDQLEQMIDGIIAYKQEEAGTGSVQEFIHSYLAENAGSGDTEWYIIGLSQYKDNYDYSEYISSLSSYTEGIDSAKATDMQRIALAFSAVDEETPFIQKTLETTIGELGIMSELYGLILMDSRGYEADTQDRDIIIERILSLRLEDGGWALMGNVSDTDITAMALQALAPYVKSAEIAQVLEEALTLLSNRQLENGDYASWGIRNCESTAQVLTALCALDIEYQRDERFIKNDNTVLDGLLLYNSDGGYSHTIEGISNNKATTQALYSLVACWRQMKGMGRLYEFNQRTESPTADNKEIENSGVNEQEKDSKEIENSEEDEQETDSKEIENTEADEQEIDRSESDEQEINIQETNNSEKNIRKSDGQKAGIKNIPSYKISDSLIILLMSLFMSVILLIRKKLNKKNLLFLLIIAGIAIAVLWTVRIQSVDDYYQSGRDIITPESKRVEISIRCDTIAGQQSSGQISHVPSDGIIIDKMECVLYDGDSVFDVLVRATKQERIPIEYEGLNKSALGTVYIKGIDNIYEFEYGDLSGWMYRVNGEFPGESCSNYILSEGDKIEWVYSLDLGKDVSE